MVVVVEEVVVVLVVLVAVVMAVAVAVAVVVVGVVVVVMVAVVMAVVVALTTPQAVGGAACIIPNFLKKEEARSTIMARSMLGRRSPGVHMTAHIAYVTATVGLKISAQQDRNLRCNRPDDCGAIPFYRNHGFSYIAYISVTPRVMLTCDTPVEGI